MVIGKVPSPLVLGPVKDAASRFSLADWNAISPLRGPAVNAAWPDFGFWFNYFWDEAITVESLTQAEKQILVETFLGIFENHNNAWRMRTDPQAIDSYHRLKMLRNLLHIGFVRVPYQTGGPKGMKPMVAEEGTRLFKEEVKFYRNREQTDFLQLKIGWRCDSRPYEMLVTQNGFQARARQDHVDREWNLTQPWHPYSLEVYRNAIYLRRGKNYDNCLHTAVSVGTDFKALVHFPLFTDASLYTYPNGPITWAHEIVVNRRGEKARVGSDKLGSYLEHDTQLYAIRIDDSIRGYDTQAFQKKAGKDPFPERSVDGIPLENILARVLITRKYWWDTTEPAHWEFFDIECKTIEILSKTIVDYHVGPYAENVLRTHIQGQVQAAKTRSDILFSKSKREKILTAPPSTQAKQRKICPKCNKPIVFQYDKHVAECGKPKPTFTPPPIPTGPPSTGS